MAFAETVITAPLADYAVSPRPEDLPDPVRRAARRSLFNIIGCTIGGARYQIADLADTTLAPFAGPRQATWFARARKSDIPHATPPRPSRRRPLRVSDGVLRRTRPGRVGWGLGSRFQLLRSPYKSYPRGLGIPPMIDACLPATAAGSGDRG